MKSSTRSPMKEPPPQQARRISPLLTVVLLLLVGLPLAYFVTAGPALGYVNHCRYTGGAAVPWLEAIYQPAATVVEGTPLEKPFRSYLKWWHELLEPKPPLLGGTIFRL